MIIRGKSIRNIDQHLDPSNYGNRRIFGVKLDPHTNQLLTNIGFSPNPSLGDSVLPAPDFGPVSRFNAEGKVKIHRDQPMETAYRQVEWHWNEFRGRYDTEEQSKIVDVPYDRYPRTFIAPPSVELTIGKTASGNKALLAPPILPTQENKEDALHIINLFLEIFNECEVFSELLEEMITSPIRRLNWRILPPGRYPWPKLKTEIAQILKDIKKGNQPVIEARLESINSYGPDFHAVGEAGFRGYVIFGFPQKNLFLLESMYFGNATYVFADNWESLSKRTKAEILNENLQKDRIIHREGWQQKIHKLLVG